MKLHGQVALITGAGRGIGRDLSLGLAAEGVRVGLVGRDQSTLSATVAECAELGTHALAFVADVTNDAQVRAAVNTVERDLGPEQRLARLAILDALARKPTPSPVTDAGLPGVWTPASGACLCTDMHVSA